MAIHAKLTTYFSCQQANNSSVVYTLSILRGKLASRDELKPKAKVNRLHALRTLFLDYTNVQKMACHAQHDFLLSFGKSSILPITANFNVEASGLL